MGPHCVCGPTDHILGIPHFSSLWIAETYHRGVCNVNGGTKSPEMRPSLHSVISMDPHCIPCCYCPFLPILTGLWWGFVINKEQPQASGLCQLLQRKGLCMPPIKTQLI